MQAPEVSGHHHQVLLSIVTDTYRTSSPTRSTPTIPHTIQTTPKHSRSHVRQPQQRARREARRRARQRSSRAHAHSIQRRKSITTNHPLHKQQHATQEELPTDSSEQNTRIETWIEAFAQDLGEELMRDVARALEEGVHVGGKVIK